MFRVVHYLNQFFGQIGGEEQAGIAPRMVEKPVGPGLALQAALGEQARVVGTVICGDNYFAEQPEQAAAGVVALIKSLQPDLVVAGPAFNAGRYGPACGAVCKAVQEQLGVPAVTGMYAENPGLELYRRDIYCVKTGPSAAGMRQAIPVMAALGLKLASGGGIGSPEEEGYFPRGIRRNAWSEKTGAARAVEMLLAKLQGSPYHTELPMPLFERVPVAPPVVNMADATIALVTEGGIVPRGNPDRLESARATKFLKYSLDGIDDLSGEQFQSVHGGYSNVFANEDPDRVLPVDVLRDLEKEGRIGRLYPYFYTTTGNGTTLENGQKFGQAIAGQLKKDGVEGVILTST